MNSFTHLQTYNIKPSLQRLAIMDYLMNHRTHPTADEIYTFLSTSMPTLSKTTVYNTLKLFAEHGAAQLLTIDERNSHFDANVSDHAHFLCKQCNAIYDLESTVEIRQVEGGRIEGHEVTEMHYYYKGTCKDCLSKNTY